MINIKIINGNIAYIQLQLLNNKINILTVRFLKNILSKMYNI